MDRKLAHEILEATLLTWGFLKRQGGKTVLVRSHKLSPWNARVGFLYPAQDGPPKRYVIGLDYADPDGFAWDNIRNVSDPVEVIHIIANHLKEEHVHKSGKNNPYQEN